MRFKRKRDSTVAYVGTKEKNHLAADYCSAAVIPYTNGTAGGTLVSAVASGPVFNQQAVNAYWANSWLFEPDGQIISPTGDQGAGGTVSVTSVGILRFGRPHGFREEASKWYYYRVRKITLNWYVRDIGDADVGCPELYIRRIDEYQKGTPSFETPVLQNGWVRKTFTNDSRKFSFSFTPKIQQTADGSAVASSRRPIKMPFLRVGQYSTLFGVEYLVVYPAGVEDSSQLVCDVKYHCQFRDRASG